MIMKVDGEYKLTSEQMKCLQEMIKNVKPWMTPQELEARIKEWMLKKRILFEQVYIAGNVRNCRLIIVFYDKSGMAFDSLRNVWSCMDKEEILEEEKRVFNRPKVLLINICNIELRPVPRLNLSIGVIAGYLRDKDVAEVTIIDMQMGTDIRAIIDKCKNLHPDIIGMSVDFKEYDIAEELLKEFDKNNIKATKVLGNILPFLLSEKFLKDHPQVLISYGEGEESWCDLALWKSGKLAFDQISGIRYWRDGRIFQTPIRYIDMKNCKLPALDTLPLLAARNGILTLELSRGCDYSACAFCPREHKTSFWRGMPAEIAVNQIAELTAAAKMINMPSLIYLADEELVGELSDGTEYKRIEEIGRLLIKNHVDCTLNASVRADSLYNAKKTMEENEKIIYAWRILKEAGLEKLFIGVESGTEEQLKRYGKGTTPDQNIWAIRLATILGIQIRVGFVMFDPLMENEQELFRNMMFLNRKDAVLKPQKKITNKRVLDIIKGQEVPEEFLTGDKIYKYVSYLFTGLEVFVKAPYFQQVKQFEKKRNVKLLGEYDWELGKIKTKYVNEQIGILQKKLEEWVEENYSLTYTLKCLAKNAPAKEKEFLYWKVFEYRDLFFQMVASIFIKNNEVFLEPDSSYSILSEKKIEAVISYWKHTAMNEYLINLQKEFQVYIKSEAKRMLLAEIISSRKGKENERRYY